MNVLVITQYFWPETFRINEVAESLAALGCNVTVLTGQPNYPDGKVFRGYRAWGIGRDSKAPGGRVWRVPMLPRGKGSAWRLSANYVSFVVSACLFGPWLLRRTRFDIIFIYAISPITQVIPGMLLRKLKNAALVTWVQDLWPQSLEVTGFVRNRSLLAAVERLVRWIYRHNDLLLVQSRAFVPLVQSMAAHVPVRYHPNPGEMLLSEQLSPGRPLVEFEPGFNVVFSGNLGTVQGLETILEAAELLREHRDVHVVLVGSGSRAEWLRQETERRHLDNIRLAGRVPPEAMPLILTRASALLVSLTRSSTMSQTIPSKLQAYLAAGRPVLASLDGEGARVVEEAGAGLVCRAGDAAALAGAILRLKAMPEAEQRRLGESGRQYYQRHFDPHSLAQTLLEHFSEAALAR